MKNNKKTLFWEKSFIFFYCYILLILFPYPLLRGQSARYTEYEQSPTRPTSFIVPDKLEGVWKAKSLNELAYYLKIDGVNNKMTFQIFTPFIVDILKSKLAYYGRSAATLPFGFEVDLAEVYDAKSIIKDQIEITPYSVQINFGIVDSGAKKLIEDEQKLLFPGLPIKEGFIKISYSEKNREANPQMSYHIVIDKEKLWRQLTRIGIFHNSDNVPVKTRYEKMREGLIPGFSPPSWLQATWETQSELRKYIKFSKNKIEFLHQNTFIPFSHFYNFLTMNEKHLPEKYVVSDHQVYFEVKPNYEYYYFDRVSKIEKTGKLVQVSLVFK